MKCCASSWMPCTLSCWPHLCIGLPHILNRNPSPADPNMVEALRKQLDALNTQLKASEELEEVRMAVSRAIVRLEDARDREARMAHELNNAIRAVNEVRMLGGRLG